jgi:hypothetical protein
MEWWQMGTPPRHLHCLSFSATAALTRNLTYDGWNAATSEGLGTFYSEQLARNPRDFLAALETFPAKRQLYLCTMAGGTDGGGMGPKPERKVLVNLKEIGGQTAILCARGVRLGNQDANSANSDLPTKIPK